MTLSAEANGSSIADADFRLIAEAIPHIVWLAGPDGSTEYFNGQGTTYTGRPVEANFGWGWLSLVHPDDAERSQLAWEQAIRADQLASLKKLQCQRAQGYYLARPMPAADLAPAGGRVTPLADRLTLRRTIQQMLGEYARPGPTVATKRKTSRP